MADDFGRPLGETHTSYDVSPAGYFVVTRLVAPSSSIKPNVQAVLNWAQGLH